MRAAGRVAAWWGTGVSASRRRPWLFLERDQLVLCVLAVLSLAVVAARYAATRWLAAKDVRKIEPGERIDYRVDVNRADAEELDLLPGIGPAKAEAIVADRAARGHFRSVEDLARVRGVTRAIVEQFRDLVTVGRACEGKEPPE